MATEKIDTLQTAQIKTLEANINELKDKLNLMVNDVLAITTKVNTVIGDMNDMNDVIMAGYTTPGSPESYGILEGMDVHKDDLEEHISRNTPQPPVWPYNDPSHAQYWDREANMTGGDYDFPWWYSTSFAIPKFYNQWIAHKEEWRPEASGGSSFRTSGNIPGNSWTAGDPALGGTGQGGNSPHTAGAQNSTASGDYETPTKRMLVVKRSEANRAKKLTRQTLNRLRK